MKTIEQTCNKNESRYASWQEASRKDVERAFGVLQRKFQILMRAVELWYVEDIKKIVECTIILHNMMVQFRLERDEREDCNMYKYLEETFEDERDHDREYAEQQLAEIQLHQTIEKEFFGGAGNGSSFIAHESGVFGSSCNSSRRQLEFQTVARRWDVLCDERKHFALRSKILEHITNTSTSSSNI